MASDLPYSYSPPVRRNSALEHAQNNNMLQSPAHLKTELDYAMSPEQSLQATPDYTTGFCTADTPFDSPASMTSPNDSGQAAYMTPQSQSGSLWSVAVKPQPSGDELDNYAAHSSPPSTAGFPSHIGSNQSSPRHWGSQHQFRPVSWDSAPTPSHHVSFVHQSPSPLPSTSNPSYAPANVYLTNPFDMYQPLPGEYDPGSPHGSSLTYDQEPEDNMGDDNAAGYENEDLYQEDDVKAESPADSHVLVSYSPDSNDSVSPSPDPDTCARSSAAAAKQNDLSYAKLLHQAFMSTERHAMTLQEIYQWFMDNYPEKAKPGVKAWQNSIRHNLSMNDAFQTREILPSEGPDDQGADSPQAGTPGASGASARTSGRTSTSRKRNSEWSMEPWAVRDGVQSTTRYRKGPARRRGTSTANGGGVSKKPPSRIGSAISSRTMRSSRSRHRNYTTTGNLYRGAAAISVSGAAFPSHYLPQNYHLLTSSPPPPSHNLVSFPATSSAPAVTSAPTYLDYAPYSHTHDPSEHHYTHRSSQSQAMARTHSLSSESGIDEPNTPEPYGESLSLSIREMRLGVSAPTHGLGGYLTTAAGAGIDADLYGLPRQHQSVTETVPPAQAMGLGYHGLVQSYGDGWVETTAQRPGPGCGQDRGQSQAPGQPGGQFHGRY